MQKRDTWFDEGLQLEAYYFRGVMQDFPNHFHEYYVIGFLEAGQRRLDCRNEKYMLMRQDMIFFNPGDCHASKQVGTEPFRYRSLNITQQVMKNAAYETCGLDILPHFRAPVIRDAEYAALFCRLHRMILEDGSLLEKQEAFYILLGRLIAEYAGALPGAVPADSRIETVCDYLETHYGQAISLEQLSDIAGLNKYSLLRAFVRTKGITPYRYLEAVRISHARKMLEQGASLSETAFLTGFSDQSHFSHFFMRLIGLTPGQYRAMF